ncbi:MAG TPA: fumarate reductase subunit C [Candidatus Binatia bacterium]|nr:fumarate reductase subunit C [Candidatus Binatia bacterium]
MREPYRRPISLTWWLHKRNYLLFMLRELTVVFVAAFLIFYLVQLSHLAKGPESYAAFLGQRSSFGWILFQILALIAALYHSVTWFNLTPKVMVVHRGEEKISPVLIAGPHYAAWLAISVVILWIVLRS